MGITIALVNRTRVSHFFSFGYSPGKAKLRSLMLVIGNTIVIENISNIAHFILIQS